MAQKMVDEWKKRQYRNVAVQTGDFEEFKLNFSNFKSVRLYYSMAYKDFVLSFNLGNSKKFILTKTMWKLFRNYLAHIDKVLYKKNEQVVG